MSNTPNNPSSLHWPAKSFYWAEVEGLGWSKYGPLPFGLLATLADEFPVPIERLHAVGVPIQGGRLLVCACERDTLQQVDPALIELKPETVPPGVASNANCDRLNLLVGDFEPAAIRWARRSRHLHLAVTALVCVTAISIGLMRRATLANTAASQTDKAATALLTDFTSDRREQGMTQQLQGMKTIIELTTRAKIAPDAAVGFEALLKAWPAEVPCKPQSVTVSGDGISLGVVVEGDPAPFLKAFSPPATYSLDEPRVTSAGPVTRLSLHLSPRASGGPSK